MYGFLSASASALSATSAVAIWSGEYRQSFPRLPARSSTDIIRAVTSRIGTENPNPSAAAAGFDISRFNQAYDKVVIGNHFFEAPSYYQEQRIRYRRTMQHIAQLALPAGSKVLDVGGGQIALLCHEMFGHDGIVADVNRQYADAATDLGLRFVECDLLHDDLPDRDEFDLVALCEVVEHLTIPPYIVLERVKRWIKPGGILLITTPNLYRIRNTLRFLTGRRVFCPFFYPERGQPIGHPLEYYPEHLKWQLEKAGFKTKYIVRQQLVNVGASPAAKVARFLIAPLLLVPLWRDSMVAIAQRPVV